MDFNAKPSCKGDSRSLSCNLRAYFQNLELLTSEESRSSCPDKQVFAGKKKFFLLSDKSCRVGPPTL
jgi:hypothetical protein